MLALALDLVWGYCGILSLGHGAFFALGGYAMGMYLMRQIGSRGVYGNPILPDFMVFLNWKELPWYWHGFDISGSPRSWWCWCPALLAFVFGWFAFRTRVTGVYLSIITQAMTYALLLAFFRNDMGFGGNNGLTDFKDILGFNMQADGDPRGAVRRLGARPGARLPVCRVHRRLASSARCWSPMRDAESRTRFLGYRVEHFKLFVLTFSAMHRRHRRRALRAAGRHHQSRRVRAGQLDRGGDLGGGRRPRHALVGAVVGALVVNCRQVLVSPARLPELWLFALGGLFVAAHPVPAQGHRRPGDRTAGPSDVRRRRVAPG